MVWKRLGLVSALLVLGLVVSACGGSATTGSSGGGSSSGNNITLHMSEYKFTPDKLTFKAGEKVTITFVNDSKENKNHEWKLGQSVHLGGSFKDTPTGFEKDFFKGVAITLVSAEGVNELHPGQGTVTGANAEELIKNTEPFPADEPNTFTINLKPGGKATISFVVPASATGTWEYGCFEDDGQHFKNGMKGTVTVEGK